MYIPLAGKSVAIRTLMQSSLVHLLSRAYSVYGLNQWERESGR